MAVDSSYRRVFLEEARRGRIGGFGAGNGPSTYNHASRRWITIAEFHDPNALARMAQKKEAGVKVGNYGGKFDAEKLENQPHRDLLFLEDEAVLMELE